MRTNYLEKLFNPQSIAVIGASDKPLSVGANVLSNLLRGNFSGTIYPVNPKHTSIQGKPCFASVKDINQSIDLAVIITPATTVARVLTECGEKNIQQVIILSAGFSEIKDGGELLEKDIVEIARHYRIRMIGPNCLGVMRPSVGLNATFENSLVLPGNLAFISQSGALIAAILDWAIEEQIGFSTLVSLGNSADLDFGDILDYLALDHKTDCILLYIEGVRDARRFMSGLRAAASLKPVIVLKAGRNSQGSRAAVSHTGAMIGDDDVFDAALRRAGVVRVMSINDLFLAAEIFSSGHRTQGARLAIVTNGGGAGVMAADFAADLKINLPELSQKTISRINDLLPNHGGHHNPIDILGDATPERYYNVIDACLKDENCDALLVILVPVAMSQPLKVAKLLVELSKQTDKPILACWMGQKQVKSSWDLFSKHKIPYFSTPETAVKAFSYLVSYYQNQQLLLQVPEPISYPSQSGVSQSDVVGARLIIESAAAAHRSILTTIESKAILNAFGIPSTQTMVANTATDALIAAESLGFPVVMKINSPDITHKQDVGGVQLNITNAEAVRCFFNQLTDNAKKKRPDAIILGVTVERMYKTPNDRELMIGILKDPVFGPIINFGAGGSLVEIMQDRALTLPPLNQYLAKNLIERTHVAKLLGDFRNKPAVNLKSIEALLLRVSEMVCELPQIQEMDINPLIVNDKELIAVDARIVINYGVPSRRYSHMAIHPYPSYLVSQWQLTDGTPIMIRPIRPEDATFEQHFVRHLSPQSKHFDYDREMAFVAVIQHHSKATQPLSGLQDKIIVQEPLNRPSGTFSPSGGEGNKEGGSSLEDTIIGIANYVTNPDLQSCEFALVIADQWQNKGIGWHLMTRLMDAAKTKNLNVMEGMILADNLSMLTLVKNLGFSCKTDSNDPTLVSVTKSIL